MTRALSLSLLIASACVGEVDGTVVDDAASTGDAASIGDDGSQRDAQGSDAAPSQPRLMYVSVGQEARLAVVELAVDGTMSARSDLDLALPGNPGAMAYARAARRLYVGVEPGSIATVTLDTTGLPALLGSTSDTGLPVYLAVAHGDNVLVTAYFGADELRTHDIAGAPPHTQTRLVATADEPHAALVGPTGARVYVPHRNGNTTRWYDLSAGGELTFADELAAEPGVGPRHIAFTPDGAYAYIVNEYADSISAHTVGPGGALARFQTLSTIPGGFDGASNTCADVHVSPDGRFVYASNRGHDSIAMFAIGPDGSLTSLGQEPTEATPREFDVSPDGRFIVAAGQASGFLQSYRVQSDGRLSSVARLQVGADLRWVVID